MHPEHARAGAHYHLMQALQMCKPVKAIYILSETGSEPHQDLVLPISVIRVAGER